MIIRLELLGLAFKVLMIVLYRSELVAAQESSSELVVARDNDNSDSSTVIDKDIKTASFSNFSAASAPATENSSLWNTNQMPDISPDIATAAVSSMSPPFAISKSPLDQLFNILFDLFTNQTSPRTGNETETQPVAAFASALPAFILAPSGAAASPLSSSSTFDRSFNDCSRKIYHICCKKRTHFSLINSTICHGCADCPCICVHPAIGAGAEAAAPPSKASITEQSSVVTPTNSDSTQRASTAAGAADAGGSSMDAIGGSGESLNIDMSINSYTLALSIGLPCISIVLIICALFSITYCCRSGSNTQRRAAAAAAAASARNASSSASSNGQRHPIGNPDVSFIYIDIDSGGSNVPPGRGITAAASAANPLSNAVGNHANNQNKDGKPPNYHEVFSKSSNVDKLPTYNSFREKKNSLKA